jgi:hypothetical protein
MSSCKVEDLLSPSSVSGLVCGLYENSRPWVAISLGGRVQLWAVTFGIGARLVSEIPLGEGLACCCMCVAPGGGIFVLTRSVRTSSELKWHILDVVDRPGLLLESEPQEGESEEEELPHQLTLRLAGSARVSSDAGADLLPEPLPFLTSASSVCDHLVSACSSRAPRALLAGSVFRGVVTVFHFEGEGEQPVAQHTILASSGILEAGASPQLSSVIAVALERPKGGENDGGDLVLLDASFLPPQNRLSGALLVILYCDKSRQGAKDLWPTHLLCVSVDAGDGSLSPGPWRVECVHPETVISPTFLGLLVIAPVADSPLNLYGANGFIRSVEVPVPPDGSEVEVATLLPGTEAEIPALAYVTAAGQVRLRQVRDLFGVREGDDGGDNVDILLLEAPHVHPLPPRRGQRLLTAAPLRVPLLVVEGCLVVEYSTPIPAGGGPRQVVWQQRVEVGPGPIHYMIPILHPSEEGQREAGERNAGPRLAFCGGKSISLAQFGLSMYMWADGDIGLKGQSPSLQSAPLRAWDRDLLVFSDGASGQSHFMVVSRLQGEAAPLPVSHRSGKSDFLREEPTLLLFSDEWLQGDDSLRGSSQDIIIQVAPSGVVAVNVDPASTRRICHWKADGKGGLEHASLAEGTQTLVLASATRIMTLRVAPGGEGMEMRCSITRSFPISALAACRLNPSSSPGNAVHVAVTYWDQSTVDLLRLQEHEGGEISGMEEESSCHIGTSARSLAFIQVGQSGEEGGGETVLAVGLADGRVSLQEVGRLDDCIGSFSSGGGRTWGLPNLLVARCGPVNGGGREQAARVIVVNGRTCDAVISPDLNSQRGATTFSCQQVSDEEWPGRRSLVQLSDGSFCWLHSETVGPWRLRFGAIDWDAPPECSWKSSALDESAVGLVGAPRSSCIVCATAEPGAAAHKLRAFDCSSLREVGSTTLSCPAGIITGMVSLTSPVELSRAASDLIALCALEDSATAAHPSRAALHIFASPDPPPPQSSFYVYEVCTRRQASKRSQGLGYAATFEPLGSLRAVAGACYCMTSMGAGGHCMAAAVDSSLMIIGWDRDNGRKLSGLEVLSSAKLASGACVTALAATATAVAVAEFMSCIHVYTLRDGGRGLAHLAQYAFPGAAVITMSVMPMTSCSWTGDGDVDADGDDSSNSSLLVAACDQLSGNTEIVRIGGGCQQAQFSCYMPPSTSCFVFSEDWPLPGGAPAGQPWSIIASGSDGRLSRVSPENGTTVRV